MPQVPIYGSPKVAPGALPAPFQGAPQADGAAAIGAGVAQLGGAFAAALGDDARQAEVERRKAESLQLDAAETELRSFSTTRLRGLLNQSGPALFGSVSGAYDDLDKEISRIRTTLSSDDQRALWDVAAASHRVGFDDDLQRHVGQATERFENETFKAGFDAIKSRVALSVANGAVRMRTDGTIDDSRLAEAQGDVRRLVLGFAQRNQERMDVDPVEWAEATDAELRSQMHAAALEQLIAAGHDRTAKAYFERHKVALAPDARAALERSVATSSTAGESLRLSTEAFTSHYLVHDGTLTEAARFQAVLTTIREQAGDDAKLEETAVRRAKMLRDEQLLLRESDRREKFANLQKSLQDGIPGDAVLTDPAVADLEPGEVATLNEMVALRAKGVMAETQDEVLWELRSMLADEESRSKFMALDLNRFVTQLKNEDWRFLKERQDDLKTGNPKLLHGFVTEQQLIDGAAAGLFPDLATNDDDDKRARAALQLRFKLDMSDLLIAEQQRLARELSFQERRDLLARWTAATVFKGPDKPYWFTGNLAPPTVYEVVSGNAGEHDVDDIPSEDFLEVRQSLLSDGIQPTDAAVLRRYIEILRATAANAEAP